MERKTKFIRRRRGRVIMLRSRRVVTNGISTRAGVELIVGRKRLCLGEKEGGGTA